MCFKRVAEKVMLYPCVFRQMDTLLKITISATNYGLGWRQNCGTEVVGNGRLLEFPPTLRSHPNHGRYRGRSHQNSVIMVPEYRRKVNLWDNRTVCMYRCEHIYRYAVSWCYPPRNECSEHSNGERMCCQSGWHGLGQPVWYAGTGECWAWRPIRLGFQSPYWLEQSPQTGYT